MRKISALLAAVFVFSSIPVYAQTDAGIPTVKPKVKTLAAFKNGLAFVFKAGETALKDGWAMLDEIPPAALGSLWIGTTSTAGRVEEVISSRGTMESELDVLNIGELLEANIGRQAVLTYQPGNIGEVKQVEGTIISVPKDRRPDNQGPTPVPQPDRYNPFNPGQIVMVKTADGRIITINKNLITSVEMASDTPVKTKVSREVNTASVRIGGKPKSAEITLAYLEKGVTWSPSYLINIKNEKEADITLEAVLANDAEDLENAEVSFVVGYPNFMFSDILTPLSTRQSVASFVQTLMQGNNNNQGGARYKSVAMQSIALNSAAYDSYEREWEPDTSYTTQGLPGESNEDLFFYKQKNVTLKKGDRARYTVFSDKVPYSHVYQWEIPDSMNIDDRGYQQGGQQRSAEELEQVWHSLRIDNNTKQPWTTAPAFVVNGSMPAAQDVLKYTPPTGKNTLKLTVATDVRAEQSQIEVGRKIVNPANNAFDEITVEGTLTVKNLKQKQITVNIKKSMIGQVLSSSEGGKVSKVAKRLSAINPQSEIEWEFPLAAGANKQLTYKYKIQMHR
ncbi:MAG: hypothetical protein ACYC27_12965 [Armatimonadota bacterium]